MQSQEGLLTPQYAKELLASQVKNRRVIPSAVADYTRQIKEGLWKLTAEPIIIAESGRMIQGQHRCLAVMAAGIPIEVLFVYGADESSFDVLDTGRKRGADSILSIAGYDRTRLQAAVAKIVIQFYQGTVANNSPCTPQEVLSFVGANAESLNETLDITTGLKQKAAIIGAVHFIFARVNKNRADSFVEAVKDGIGIVDKANPAYRLREKLNTQPKGGRFDSRDVLAWTFLAMNNFFLGRPQRGFPLSGTSEGRYKVNPAIATRLAIPRGIGASAVNQAAATL